LHVYTVYLKFLQARLASRLSLSPCKGPKELFLKIVLST
jgi:hypothetical protein